MNNEKQPGSNNEKLDQAELDKIAGEALQTKAEKLERRSPERSSAERADKSRGEALEQAKPAKNERLGEARPEKSAVKHDTPPNSKAARKEAFDTIMSETRSQMSPAGRSFSKFIHAPIVEKVSDVTGKTVARPNAILAGSLSAFVLVLAVYLVARHYGYPLSGAETMVAFAAGWVLGVLFDFLRLMITGRHN